MMTMTVVWISLRTEARALRKSLSCYIVGPALLRTSTCSDSPKHPPSSRTSSWRLSTTQGWASIHSSHQLVANRIRTAQALPIYHCSSNKAQWWWTSGTYPGNAVQCQSDGRRTTCPSSRRWAACASWPTHCSRTGSVWPSSATWSKKMRKSLEMKIKIERALIKLIKKWNKQKDKSKNSI